MKIRPGTRTPSHCRGVVVEQPIRIARAGQPRPSARTEQVTIPSASATRNRRGVGPGGEPDQREHEDQASREEHALVLGVDLFARAPAVRLPHTRFSEEAATSAAGPAE